MGKNICRFWHTKNKRKTIAHAYSWIFPILPGEIATCSSPFFPSLFGFFCRFREETAKYKWSVSPIQTGWRILGELLSLSSSKNGISISTNFVWSTNKSMLFQKHTMLFCSLAMFNHCSLLFDLVIPSPPPPPTTPIVSSNPCILIPRHPSFPQIPTNPTLPHLIPSPNLSKIFTWPVPGHYNLPPTSCHVYLLFGCCSSTHNTNGIHLSWRPTIGWWRERGSSIYPFGDLYSLLLIAAVSLIPSGYCLFDFWSSFKREKN